MREQLRLAVIGLGEIGRFRAETLAFADGVEVVLGWDADPANLELAAGLATTLTTDRLQLTTATGLDGIIICTAADLTPGWLHMAEHLQRPVAIEHGSFPPLHLNGLEPLRRVYVLDPPGVDSSWSQARSLVEEGRLGSLQRLRCTRRIVRALAPDTHTDATEREMAFRLALLAGTNWTNLLVRPTGRRQTLDDGFFAVIWNHEGNIATIDYDPHSPIADTNGWEVIGARASIGASRCFTTMPDGEIVDIPLPASDFQQIPWWHNFTEPAVCQQRLSAAQWSFHMMAAMQRSLNSGQVEAIEPLV